MRLVQLHWCASVLHEPEQQLRSLVQPPWPVAMQEHDGASQTPVQQSLPVVQAFPCLAQLVQLSPPRPEGMHANGLQHSASLLQVAFSAAHGVHLLPRQASPPQHWELEVQNPPSCLHVLHCPLVSQ